MLSSFLSYLEQWKQWTSCISNTAKKSNRMNAIFWYCVFFAIVFQYFSKLIQVSALVTNETMEIRRILK